MVRNGAAVLETAKCETYPVYPKCFSRIQISCLFVVSHSVFTYIFAVCNECILSSNRLWWCRCCEEKLEVFHSPSESRSRPYRAIKYRESTSHEEKKTWLAHPQSARTAWSRTQHANTSPYFGREKRNSRDALVLRCRTTAMSALSIFT